MRPARWSCGWARRRRSGRRPTRCRRGSKNTECRKRCTWIGRTCINARPRSANSCGAKSRSRSLAGCAKSWGSRSSRRESRKISAGSPKAKGRVERNHGTHQDRLIKKMRRKKIGTHEQANVYLQREYLPEHNERFRRAAAESENYHRQAPSEAELREVFRLETERVIGKIG